ncbi:MAG: DUF1552 domain-containing protein [Planctomyces sp.]|nr:DUF1552 domain-containing protein [Planctomyces sp.]
MSGQHFAARRMMLRGLGVSLALPFLESTRSARLFGSEIARAAAGGPPQRMACIFVPNGVHMQDWTPATQGFGFKLPYVLEPLAPVQDDLLVLSGLTHDKGRANGDGPGDHARSASVFLTGAQPRKTAGANIRSGMSVDQMAARAIGRETRFASLELGCEGGRSAGNCDSGYSCAYSSNISWAGEANPLAKETNPKLVFERMFGSGNASEATRGRGQREALKKSLLDFVADDARTLQTRLGKSDQRKLDEYLTGVREIERRIEQSAAPELPEELADFPVPEGTPKDYAEHLRLMCDMVVLAFQTDSTRIATVMFADAGSNRSYRQIEVPDGHHDLSHHGGDPQKHAKIRKINHFHVTQLSYLLQRLKSIPEGNGSLLDNCMVLYGSGLGDGNRHNHDNLPVLMAGRAGGTIDTGRHIQYPTETPMCNLLLSMLDRVGAPSDFIGDSTGRLHGLQV